MSTVLAFRSDGNKNIFPFCMIYIHFDTYIHFRAYWLHLCGVIQFPALSKSLCRVSHSVRVLSSSLILRLLPWRISICIQCNPYIQSSLEAYCKTHGPGQSSFMQTWFSVASGHGVTMEKTRMRDRWADGKAGKSMFGKRYSYIYIYLHNNWVNHK